MYCCDRKLGNPYKNVKINIQREKGWDRVRERREGERDEERDSYPLLIILDLNLMSKSQQICPAFPMVSCIVFGYKKIFFFYSITILLTQTHVLAHLKIKLWKNIFYSKFFRRLDPLPTVSHQNRKMSNSWIILTAFIPHVATILLQNSR